MTNDGAITVPTLHVLQGPDKGRTYETPNEPALIGRHSDQIQLSDDGASRHHAEIRPDNGDWILEDLNSSNGTFLNGQRIVGPTPLNHGDQIKLGTTLMVFSGEGEGGTASGGKAVPDLVDLEMGPAAGGSSILSAVNGSEESVILQSPETADAVAAWNVVYKVAEMIGSVEAVDPFLERVADILFEHLIVDHLVLLMCAADGETLEPKLVRFRPSERKGRPKIVTSHTIIKHVMETREGVLCANAMNDARFSSEDSQDSIHVLGLRSVICVPVVAHDEVLGVFHLDCSMSHHTYTQEQLRLAVAIGRLAGLAIENTRLQEARMRTARLAAAGETVAFLSHHIRNMLQGMQGGAEVVELGLKKKSLDSAASGWTLVRSNLDRIFHLTLNMLTFSKDRQPRVQTAQLNHIVEEVISLAQGRADEKGVMILAELGDIPATPLDPEGVHQVVHNVVLNAIDASPADGGRVNVRTRYDTQKCQVSFSVSDNGPGIPEEEKDKVFDAFHSSKGHGGTGLGLAAAKKIVNELSGRIEVESEPGEGCTFHVVFPGSDLRLADSDKTHGAPRP